jgi:hypothetical protein
LIKPFFLIVLLLSLILFPVHALTIYTPHQGDYFNYYEIQNLGNGTGDYIDYTEKSVIIGSEMINGINADGNVSVYYNYTSNWSNNEGSTLSNSSSGGFTFSPISFLYINGTDGQTGYTNPTVWFCMDPSTPKGNMFKLLNTEMTVVSDNYSYYLPSLNEYVNVIFTKGNSVYQRNDEYGKFTATYVWKAYFDPTSGYIVGYDYAEQDTNASGTGFAYAETLYITSSSYSLTVVPSVASNGGLNDLFIAIVVIIIAVFIIVVAISIRKKRSSQQTNTSPSTMPNVSGPEVKCPYCGGPLHFGVGNVTNCEYCGREVEKPS